MATPVKMYKITEEEANSVDVKDGQLIFTTDTNKIYLDSDSKRECYTRTNIKTYVSEEQPAAAAKGDVWLVAEEHYNIKPFSQCSDEELSQYLTMHYNKEIDLANYWHIGDTRTIHLSSMSRKSGYGEPHVAQDITMVIIGMNHDDLSESINTNNKAALTLQCKEVLGNNGKAEDGYAAGRYTIEPEYWPENPERTWLNDTFFNALPDTIKSLVKTVTKKVSSNYRTGTSSLTSEDNIFLLSYPEIFGSETYTEYTGSIELEGNQYKYYESAESRIKHINNNGLASDTAKSWWLRSRSKTSDYFLYITSSGTVDFERTTLEKSTAPAFCL